MVTPAIPERVYALCKIVEKGPITASEIKEKMEPDFLGNKSSYFNDYRNAAEELGLISISDDLVSLAVEDKVVKSTDNMRKYINQQLEKFNAGQFYLVTNAFFEKGSDIFKEDKNIANLGPMFSEMTGLQVDAMAMRAWRFWASFLGFGYLQDMFIIPNANVFLKDIILESNIEKNKMYSISEFVDILSPTAIKNCNFFLAKIHIVSRFFNIIRFNDLFLDSQPIFYQINMYIFKNEAHCSKWFIFIT